MPNQMPSDSTRVRSMIFLSNWRCAALVASANCGIWPATRVSGRNRVGAALARPAKQTSRIGLHRGDDADLAGIHLQASGLTGSSISALPKRSGAMVSMCEMMMPPVEWP